MLNLLSGCSPADDAAYHEMTAEDLAKLQTEEAGSISPLETTSSKETEQDLPVPDKTETTATHPEKNPAPAPSSPDKMQPEKRETAAASKTDPAIDDNNGNKNKDNNKIGSKEKPDEIKKNVAMVAKTPGSPLIAKNNLNTNPARSNSLRPGLMQPGRVLPGDLPGKIEKRDPKLLIPEKTFRKEGKEGAIRVSFDDIDLLKVLNMEPVPEDAVKMFPAWLSELDGKRVRIRGFMFPTMSQKGITYFQHVRDNEICCFGRTPKIYDRISTVLKKGETTDYIQGRPFDVIGTLRIDPIYIDGEWLQLYMLEDAIVIDEK